MKNGPKWSRNLVVKPCHTRKRMKLQSSFVTEKDGDGATARSGTDHIDGMDRSLAASSGREGETGGASAGGTAPLLPSQPGTTAALAVEDEPMEDAIEDLDIFLQEMQEKACEDNERTVVLNAPRGLVCEESEFLLEARSRYVCNVLSHKDIGVGYDGVTSEFAILMPARYVGSNARDGGNGVEVGFLHVVFKTAKLALRR